MAKAGAAARARRRCDHLYRRLRLRPRRTPGRAARVALNSAVQGCSRRPRLSRERCPLARALLRCRASEPCCSTASSRTASSSSINCCRTSSRRHRVRAARAARVAPGGTRCARASGRQARLSPPLQTRGAPGHLFRPLGASWRPSVRHIIAAAFRPRALESRAPAAAAQRARRARRPVDQARRAGPSRRAARRSPHHPRPSRVRAPRLRARHNVMAPGRPARSAWGAARHEAARRRRWRKAWRAALRTC